MGKHLPADELNCGACGYPTCIEHAVAIWKGLAESEMCLPYTIDELRRTCGELTHSNDQLASMQEALMQSEKLASMGQLAAGIAHEVNNPLGTVVMLSHILCDEARDPQTREDLSLIVSEADRCKKIVSGLLQFARKNKVEARSVDLHRLARRAARALRPAEGIKIRVEAVSSDVTAEVDGDQIMQVLANLMSNAVAAMPGGGVLTVRVGSDAERVWIAVQDTGIGIPKENRKKIFEPFFTTKPPGKGTGLGLAVTYGIVKMHHGDIRVESNADPAAGPTGSCFTVSLPKRLHRPAEELSAMSGAT
jgi:signal transduction histidine kinase